MKYCPHVHKSKRWKTREVLIGSVGVGAHHPIRIQSMTTSNTRDVEATVEQIIRLADAGCEIARVTVQGMKEAEACEEIKNSLLQKGYTIPLVADIHFYPPAAFKVADSVDKVRINPGNFVDKRASFKVIEFNDASYAEELERIEEKFTPLVEKCKRLKRAMRIGTNHGSLSDRIMNRYGDTPNGMLESALEFARICRKNDYHAFLFSMKSSNPQVMIQAYRLLVAEMMRLGWDYPLHLGVTEAGEGEDGRVKSAMGIGSLLLDGIGDTIRVSLTEDPWLEIDPCRRLVKMAHYYMGSGVEPFTEHHRNIEQIQRREVILPPSISLHRDGSVILSVSTEDVGSPSFYKEIGSEGALQKPKLSRTSADLLVLKEPATRAESVKKLHLLQEMGTSLAATFASPHALPIATLRDVQQQSSPYALLLTESSVTDWEALLSSLPALIFLSPAQNRLHFCRSFFEWLRQHNLSIPLILNFHYTCPEEDLIIHASAECGSLLCDGIGEGLYLEGPYALSFLRNLSFNILQAARLRTFKTDFISCPSCGRTLFNLQEVTRRIHERTSHLPGVKIAIMGCIVNGPGEMADADFGYVGSRPGKIDLYVGKVCVEKDIDSAQADERLVALIKAHDRWVEPEPLPL